MTVEKQTFEQPKAARIPAADDTHERRRDTERHAT